MENTEIVKILRLFSKPLRERFQLFLDSPYCVGYNSSETTHRFFCEIFRAIDQNNPALLREDVVYLTLYPEKDTTSKNLSNLRTISMRLVKKFLVMEHAFGKMDESEERLYLAEFFSENNFPGFADRELKWLEEWRSQDRTNWPESNYATSLRSAHIHSFYRSKYHKIKGDVGILEFLKEINHFYAHFFLKYSNVLFAFAHVNQIPNTENYPNIDQKLGRPEFKHYLETPLGQLLLQANKLLQPGETASQEEYQRYREMFDALENQLSSNDINNCSTYARIHLSKRYNGGDLEALRELFELQKKVALLNPSHVKHSLVYSLIKSALILGELDWAKNFLTQNADLLEGEERRKSETHAYCEAALFYAEKKYEKAILLLLTTNFEDIQLKCQAKALEIKILFETKDEQVQNKLNAAKMFFRRNVNIDTQRRRSFLSFVNIVARLAEAGTKKNQAQRLLKAIQKEPTVAERQWLLQTLHQHT